MEVHQAYRVRGVEGEHGTWGNNTLDSMLKEFPWLTALVEALRADDGCRLPKYYKWSVLFYVDYLVGRPAKISLEMKKSRGHDHVYSIPLNADKPATLEDVIEQTNVVFAARHKKR